MQADIIARKRLLLDQNISLLVGDCQPFRKLGSKLNLLAILARTQKVDQPAQEMFESLVEYLFNPLSDCEICRDIRFENALLAILHRTQEVDQPGQEIFESLAEYLLNPLNDCAFCRSIRMEQALLAILARIKELEQSVQDLVDDLTDDSLKILSLLTWHFDAMIGAPPSPWLLHFFAQTAEQFDTVCKDIHRSYSILADSMAEPISEKKFKSKFLELLELMQFHVVNGICCLV